MWLAELETAHFSFIASGKTRHQAGVVLAKLWERHCDQYNISPYGPLFKNASALKEEASIYQLKYGEGRCNGIKILTNGHKAQELDILGYRRTGNEV